jgi:hypothetical protein
MDGMILALILSRHLSICASISLEKVRYHGPMKYKSHHSCLLTRGRGLRRENSIPEEPYSYRR